MCHLRYHEISLTKKHGASNASCLEGATWLRLANQTVLLPQPAMLPASRRRSSTSASPLAPWVQLVAGVICMAMIANLQYGWTIFVGPIDAKHHWGKAAIQGTFTLFILLETWLVPFEAYLADRFGPRPLVMIGGVMIGFSWVLFSWANTLTALYVGGMIGGVGTGLVYGTCIGNALKWFQARRGLAAGVTAAGFGAGAALTVLPLMHSLASNGYEATFFRFGLIQGIVVLLAALALKKPTGRAAARRENPRLPQTKDGSHAVRDSAERHLLADVYRFRSGGSERPDGYRATRAHRQWLRHRQELR